jgi:uncharacterized protein (TIGR02147 family)
MKPIFNYLEYRDFLKDHYEFNKQKYPFFSFRYIALKTGLDASFYVKVLQKQMHISRKAIDPICHFLGFGKKESDYFKLLVNFNRAKQGEKSREYFEKLLELREPRTQKLDRQAYEYFSSWYHVAIREFLNGHPFSGDYKELAEKLDPAITVAQARKAIALLEKLSLIKKNDQGTYVLTDQFVSTGESWNSLAIENFQRQAIRLAGESIARIPKKNRETSTVTVSISSKCFDAMKERLREVRKELLEMARLDDKPEGVFQVNFQVFPLTKLESGDAQ